MLHGFRSFLELYNKQQPKEKESEREWKKMSSNNGESAFKLMMIDFHNSSNFPSDGHIIPLRPSYGECFNGSTTNTNISIFYRIVVVVVCDWNIFSRIMIYLYGECLMLGRGRMYTMHWVCHFFWTHFSSVFRTHCIDYISSRFTIYGGVHSLSHTLSVFVYTTHKGKENWFTYCIIAYFQLSATNLFFMDVHVYKRLKQ